MNLPEGFLNRMKERLGARFPAFLQSYETPPVRGLRVNTHKLSREEFLRITPFAVECVPWEENGFYVQSEKPGAHVFHFAGLYYCQEPSAMLPATLLPVEKGDRMLDLCAAPGGKSTQLAQKLEAAGGGVLVANEIEPARAKILSENIERLGFANVAVVNATPEALARRFPACFHKILVDAPCSGEGMFKKEPQAVSCWSAENVARCAQRQREILRHAAEMLQEGGSLVYSTCTFAPEENEQQIEGFLNEHKEFSLVEIRRILPHKQCGEGQFAALLKKNGGDRGRVSPFVVRRDKRAERAFSAFCGEFFRREFEGDIATLQDGRMYLLPQGLPALGVKTLRAGVELGEWDGKLFKPAHALVMSAKKEDFANYVSLSVAESERYLRGEQLSAEGAGWCAVGVGDYPLGLGKCVNGALKNHYPKGLRLRTGG